MAGHCTCGSPLPRGASFCPNCGRPLRPAAELPAPATESPEIGASGPAPVWTSYAKAAMPPALCALALRAVLPLFAPSLLLHSLFIPAAAGFASVRLFQARRNPAPSPMRAFGIGALAGLLTFLGSAAMLLGLLAAHGREVILAPAREAAEAFSMQGDLERWLEDPTVFALAIASGLTIEAVSLLAVSGGGGALAAKTGRGRSR